MKLLNNNVKRVVRRVKIPIVNFQTARTITTIAENHVLFSNHKFALEINNEESERLRLINRLINLKYAIQKDDRWIYSDRAVLKLLRPLGFIEVIYRVKLRHE